MRFGVWTPLPHTIRPEPRMQQAIAELSTPGSGEGLDASYRFALDVVREAESAGFDSTLIAQRYLGPDLDAWMLSSALAAHTTTIEINSSQNSPPASIASAPAAPRSTS